MPNSMKQTHDMTSLSALAWTIRRLRLRRSAGFHLGITLRDDTKARPVPGIMQIPGGRYAVFRHTGSYSSLHKVYRSIYEEWFPKSKYHPQSTFSFEMYMNHPSTTETSELLTEIYIPVIRK